MYNQEYAAIMKENREFEQENFTQGHHNYWILKRENETIIYDRDIEIYRYNQKHCDFLKTLPLFLDKYKELEAELKKYYDYAYSSTYNNRMAQNYLRNINRSLQEFHTFLSYSDYSLIYIRRVLYEYFCKMVEYRFLKYITINGINISAINLQDLEAFYARDKEFCINLFCPINDLLLEKNKDNVTLQLNINHLWGYFLYISHCPNVLNAKVTDNDLKKYSFSNYTSDIYKQAANLHILRHYKAIADIFIDYFSFFSNIQTYYPNIKNFHVYMLLLSNNHLYTKLIDSCKFYSEHQSMYKLIRNYIRKTNPNCIAFMSQISKDFTNDIYQRIQDYANRDSDDKIKIEKDLLFYYPNEFEKNIGAVIIEFQFFEQLFAIELLDIIKQNVIIKQCPYCEKYFITNLKRQKYCEQHKNKHNVQQRIYLKNKSFESLYQPTFKRYNECIRKRYYRRKKSVDDAEKELFNINYENWKKDSLDLISKATLKKMSLDTFIDKLNSICQKHNISRPRDYNASPKKNIG